MINPWLYPTLSLAALCFAAVLFMSRRQWRLPITPVRRVAFAFVLLLLALPALTYSAYYLHLWHEPVWLYRIRAVRGSELLAAGIAILTAFVYACINRARRTVRWLRVLPVAAALVILLLPYAKPVLFPLSHSRLHEQWTADGICLQSSSSTCGPSCVATLLRHAGQMNITEAQIARECYTGGTGTENWYLKRALENHGQSATYIRTAPQPKDLPLNSIAGVRLGGPHGTGHYITVLGKEGDTYLLGDPLVGLKRVPAERLNEQYWFTGFFLVAQRQ